MSDLPRPTPDETVTCVVRPGLKRLAQGNRTNARRPPKPRTATAEVALPSVIVAEEPPAPVSHIRRASPRERQATLVLPRAAFVPQKQALRTTNPYSPHVGTRTAAVLTAAIAFVLTVVFLACLPFFTHLFGSALSIFNG